MNSDYKLSILIPSRNEEFLNETIEDILNHTSNQTEIIVALDGQWPVKPIPQDERLTVVFFPESIGQRAATKQCARLSKAKWIAKTDAHVAVDENFDTKMMAAMDGHDDWTMIPVMRNLHVFNWVCPDGHTRYQSPSGPCKEPGCNKPTVKDIVWIPKTNPQSISYCFDTEPHFQYFKEFSRTDKFKKDRESGITETMSIQGSFFMMTREKYWELNPDDESLGSWGSQGINVAARTWLSGGRVVVNHNTWYGHMFRTQGGDFSFPYPNPGRATERAKKMSKDLFFGNNWPQQVRPLSWLVERFWPVNGWTEEELNKQKELGKQFYEKKAGCKIPQKEDYSTIKEKVSDNMTPTKGIVYYTCNTADPRIMKAVQDQLNTVGLPIVSVSLKPIDFGDTNIVLYKNGEEKRILKEYANRTL